MEIWEVLDRLADPLRIEARHAAAAKRIESIERILEAERNEPHSRSTNEQQEIPE